MSRGTGRGSREPDGSGAGQGEPAREAPRQRPPDSQGLRRGRRLAAGHRNAARTPFVATGGAAARRRPDLRCCC